MPRRSVDRQECLQRAHSEPCPFPCGRGCLDRDHHRYEWRSEEGRNDEGALPPVSEPRDGSKGGSDDHRGRDRKRDRASFLVLPSVLQPQSNNAVARSSDLATVEREARRHGRNDGDQAHVHDRAAKSNAACSLTERPRTRGLRKPDVLRRRNSCARGTHTLY